MGLPAAPNIVEVGKYAPLFNALPSPLVATAVRDNTFCFAVNSKPFGDLKSKNICVKRDVSFKILPGVKRPPLRRKSGPPLAPKSPSFVGILDLM